MKEIKILISDTHYGVKQNSIMWLNSQMKFMRERLIPFIKKHKDHKITIVHLGDVFDSRSTVGVFVANEVKNIFLDISKCLSTQNPDNEIIIISGNHDYYSPIDTEDRVNVVDLILRDLASNIRIISKSTEVVGDDMFIPWYDWHNEETLVKLLEDNTSTNIFTHCTLQETSPDVKNLLKNRNVFSGHIHTPSLNDNLMTIGSCYPLTFIDCNQSRGWWVIGEDGERGLIGGKKLGFYPNKVSIEYHRLYDREIFDEERIGEVKKGDFVELYINSANISNEEYITKIKYISKIAHYCSVVPVSDIVNECKEGGSVMFNIEDICKDIVPEHLKEKFDEVLNYKKSIE